MKITRLGPSRPLLSVGGALSGGIGSGGTGAPPGQVPTSVGSNGSIAFGSNVGVITVNGTTQVLGPYVNFANGSNTTVTVDMVGATGSNTIRVHATGGGSVSFGSNSTRVSEVPAVGASTDSAKADHIHDGIGTITASSSNTLQRGTVNLRPGNNVSFGLTDTDGDGEFDTLTINGAAAGGGGSSGITVQDEGSPLSTTATTLDFVGAGVTATGSGATKTITIPGGGSGSLYPLDGYTLNGTYGDHFTSSSLDAKWTRRNFTSGAETYQLPPGGTYMRIATAGRAAGDGYFQPGPSGDWTIAMKQVARQYGANYFRSILGLCVVDSAGTGIMVQFYNSPIALIAAALTTYTYGGTFTQTPTIISSDQPNALQLAHWIYLRKDGTNYYGAFSFDGEVWSPETPAKAWAGTVDRIGMIAPLGFTAHANNVVDVDWFNKIV